MTLRRLRLCCAFSLCLLAAQGAHAQYAWIDGHGTHVFSDRPPPPGTTVKRMLKAPGRPSFADDVLPSPSATPGAAAAPSPGTAPPSLAEREADYRKRAARRDDDARKAALDAANKAKLAENCAATREYAADLASDRRMAHTGAGGEREYLSDEQRQRQLERTRQALADCR